MPWGVDIFQKGQLFDVKFSVKKPENMNYDAKI